MAIARKQIGRCSPIARGRCRLPEDEDGNEIPPTIDIVIAGEGITVCVPPWQHDIEVGAMQTYVDVQPWVGHNIVALNKNTTAVAPRENRRPCR